MTTLEFANKELKKANINLAQGKNRGVKEDQLKNLEDKVGHWKLIVSLLEN